MQEAKRRALLTLLIAALIVTKCSFAVSINVGAQTHSRGECVVEAGSFRFLHELNADLPLPMASTTKILTALIVLEDCSPDEIVIVPAEAERAEGSSVYLRRGEERTVEELLYGMMLRSGNDCAVALAIHHSGSIRKFAAVMNTRAAAMGAESSHFCNPHGLPEEGHYTTSRDLALIAAHAMGNPAFRAIVSCKFYPFSGWKNKNKLLFNGFEGACGIKTGFTRQAGRCLVAAAERGGRLLVSVVLNCPQMYERTQELLDQCFSRYDFLT